MKPILKTAVVALMLAAGISSAEFVSSERLEPQALLKDKDFAFTIHSVLTNNGARFTVTVTPKHEGRLLHVDADLMLFDGTGEIERVPLSESLHYDDRIYSCEFNISAKYLGYSQFVFRDFGTVPKGNRRGNSHWFYLRDFVTPATPTQGGANGR